MKFSSIGFCSETRGVVVGGLMKKNSFKPTAMVTSTGGKMWTQMPMDDSGPRRFLPGRDLRVDADRLRDLVHG